MYMYSLFLLLYVSVCPRSLSHSYLVQTSALLAQFALGTTCNAFNYTMRSASFFPFWECSDIIALPAPSY